MVWSGGGLMGLGGSSGVFCGVAAGFGVEELSFGNALPALIRINLLICSSVRKSENRSWMSLLERFSIHDKTYM